MPTYLQDLPMELLLLIFDKAGIVDIMEMSLLSRQLYQASKMFLSYNPDIVVTDQYEGDFPPGLGYVAESSTLFATCGRFSSLARSIKRITAYVHQDQQPATEAQHHSSIDPEELPVPRQYPYLLLTSLLCPNLVSLTVHVQQPDSMRLDIRSLHRLERLDIAWKKSKPCSLAQKDHKISVDPRTVVSVHIDSKFKCNLRDVFGTVLLEDQGEEVAVADLYSLDTALYFPILTSAMSLFWPLLFETNLGSVMTKLRFDIVLASDLEQKNEYEVLTSVLKPARIILHRFCSSLESLHIDYTRSRPFIAGHVHNERMEIAGGWDMAFAIRTTKLEGLHTLTIPAAWWCCHPHLIAAFRNGVHTFVPNSLAKLVLLKCDADNEIGFSVSRFLNKIIGAAQNHSRGWTTPTKRSLQIIELRGEKRTPIGDGWMSPVWMAAIADVQPRLREINIEAIVYESGSKVM